MSKQPSSLLKRLGNVQKEVEVLRKRKKSDVPDGEMTPALITALSSISELLSVTKDLIKAKQARRIASHRTTKL